jgi:hypothetical protein
MTFRIGGVAAFAFLLIGISPALAESPYQAAWIRQWGTAAWDTSCSVVVDTDGSVVISGGTEGTAGGVSDALLAKYDSSGQLQWTRQFGSTTGSGVGRSVATDTTSNLYLIGDDTFNTFLCKYDALGTQQWQTYYGTSYRDYCNAVAVRNGDVFTSGYTQRSGYTDAFLNKYDTSGTLQWTQELHYCKSYTVALDTLGNAFVSGTIRNITEDAFLAKYDASGSLLWTRQLISSAYDHGRSVAIDASGNALVCGFTAGSLDGANQGSNDAFISKYDASGTLIWTRQLGTSSSDDSYSVAVDTDGCAFICGDTAGDMGGSNQGGYDAFVAKYDPFGNLLWTQQFGTSKNDFASGIALDSINNVFVTGGTYGTFEGTNQGSSDMFLVKLTPVPEPSGLVLLTLGTIGLVAYSMIQRMRYREAE